MTICKIVECNNPKKDVIGIRLDVESKNTEPVFDEIYRVLNQYFSFEKEQILDGWNLYKKTNGKQGVWNFRVYDDYDVAVNRGDPLMNLAVLYHSMEPVTSDSKKGQGRSYSLQKFGVYINEVADNLNRSIVRDDILRYMKSNFSIDNILRPRYRIMVRVE